MEIILFALGILCLLFCISLLKDEMEHRRSIAKETLKTVLVPLRNEFKPVPITYTEIFIGRRSRRCDVDLSSLPISREHAVLWWDGETFRIAPKNTLHRDGTLSKPSVSVNSKYADENGLPVLYNDVVTFEWLNPVPGRFKFTLKSAEGEM